MEYTSQDVGETLLYLMDIFQSEFAFIKLAFKEYVIYYSVDQ